MIFSVILLLAGLQDNSQQLAAQQAQLHRLEQEVKQVSSELSRMQEMLQRELKSTCSSETRLQTGTLRITDNTTPIRVNLFAMVSAPSDSCLPAEIGITATYFDSMNGFVCSGAVMIPQSLAVQNTLMEFRPYESEVFLTWWDRATLKQQMLVCRNFQGNELRDPATQAASLRIYATVFPRRGGLSTSEIEINLPRAARP
jgi:hypothetical protein